MSSKDDIIGNIDFISDHIVTTPNIALYHNGIVGINKDNNLVYLNLYNKSLGATINLNCKYFEMDCLKVDEEKNTCLISCSNQISLVDIINNKITSSKEKNINLANFYYYKNNKLIGITGKNIVLYDFNNNKMDNLLSIDSSIIYTKYIKDEIFYYADNKNLYIYDILKGILLKKNTCYIRTNKYSIVDITDNINIISLGIQRCVCFYGINNDRTKCFIVHASPSFNDIENVFNDIRKNFGEEYDKMNINILGGGKNNKSFLYLLNNLSISFNMLQHTLKPYNIIISKTETLIF
tara:strand:- start:556 stop:1437 length:882 start_codon:yes stop_codon:yes gene_type:complete